MQTNADGSASRKKVGATRRSSAPNGSRRKSSARADELRTWGLDHAVQRYADLFDFAPVSYVSFDRSGRIEEINLTAVRLFGMPRDRLIGMPFMVFVAREDTPLFLDHLLRCRASDTRVETDLRLKDVHRKMIHAYLSSIPVSASQHNGASLYQTAIIDLTSRDEAEAALRTKEAELEQIITQTPFMLTRCARDLRYRYASRAYAEMLGRKSEEIAGKSIVEVIGEEGFKKILPHIEEVLKGRATNYEMDVPFQGIGTRSLHCVYTPDWDSDGNVIGWFASIVDVTERRRAEVAAMRLTALVRSSHDAVVAKDLNGIITDWNQSAQRIFGYKPKEIIGKSIRTLIPQERQAEENEILRRIRNGESIDHYETIRRRKDGRLIDVSLTISPIKDVKGKITGVSKIARDITEHKVTERQVAEQARLLDLSNDAIFIRDWRDRIVYWNHGACELYGYSSEQALGKAPHELLRPEHPRSLAKLRKQLERDGRWSGELVHRRKDGRKIVVMSRWSLDRDERGEPSFILETNTDITVRKNAEEALQRSHQALERMVDQRTKELRVTNTELKSEIERRRGLEGEILAVSDREQQRLGQELHDGLCQHLTAVAFMARSVALRLRNHRVIDAADIDKIAQLVNSAATDTRNLSRALHRIDVDAASLSNALQDLVDREIWRVPCRLEVKPSFRIDDDSAAAQLYRIAREAVINANKHAEARQIVVKLERARQRMVLHVIDDGVGVPGEPDLKQGLGFHIMKYRAQLMGGRLEIGSPKGGGTCVSCYLPNHTAQRLKSHKKENGEAKRLPGKIAKVLATII